MLGYSCHVYNKSRSNDVQIEKKEKVYDSSLFFSFVHCFQCTITIGWLSNISKQRRMKNKNQVEDSVSSGGLVVGSLVVSTSETSLVFCSGIVEFELLIGSSIDSVFVVGGVGDLEGAGEFRCCCCSNSYSLIKRFLSGWALLDDTDVVGDADDDIGDVDIGGLLRFDGWSTFIVNEDSCWVSDEDESVCWARRTNFPFEEWSSEDVDDCPDGENCGSSIW